MVTTQKNYFAAIGVAKGGIQVGFDCSKSGVSNFRQGTLKIEHTGDMLVLEAMTQKSNQCHSWAITLANINSITLSSSTRSFTIDTDNATASQADQDSFQHKFTCLENTPTIFYQWILAVTCGANAFQQRDKRRHTSQGTIAPSDLVWQAARLRIFELAECMELPRAIEIVHQAVERFYDRNCGRGAQHLPLFLRLG